MSEERSFESISVFGDTYILTFDKSQAKYHIIPTMKNFRTELAKRGRCMDYEEGLDCGCLICGRD